MVKDFNKKSGTRLSERGSILIYSVLIMAAIVSMAITLVRTIIPKLYITREAIYSAVAIYAADSAMEWCIFSNRDDPASQPQVPPQPTLSISGVSYQIYRDSSISSCTSGQSINYRTVGNYRGISRSLEVYE